MLGALVDLFSTTSFNWFFQVLIWHNFSCILYSKNNLVWNRLSLILVFFERFNFVFSNSKVRPLVNLSKFQDITTNSWKGSIFGRYERIIAKVSVLILIEFQLFTWNMFGLVNCMGCIVPWDALVARLRESRGSSTSEGCVSHLGL